MIRRSWTQAASIEETLALWAASLREIKTRIRPLFRQERVATNAGLFWKVCSEMSTAKLVGCAQRQLAILGLGSNRRSLVARDWDADGLRDIVRDYVIEHLADDDAVLVIDETGFLKQGKASCGVRRDNTLVPQGRSRTARSESSLPMFRAAVRVHRSRAVSSEGMDRRSRSPGSRIRALRCRLCDQTTACDENDCARHRRFCAIQVGCRRYCLRCWRYRTATTPGRQRLYSGSSSAHVFHSWGKRRSVAGKAADIARTRRSSDWSRLSAGAGTKGPRHRGWCYLEVADLEVEEFSSANQGLWTRGLLIRRHITDGDLAFFTTRCPAAISIETRWWRSRPSVGDRGQF